MDGRIYILSNEAFVNGLIKIGCSSKDPVVRKKELEATGVPDDFHIEYRALISSFSTVEHKIHQFLAEYSILACSFRVNKPRKTYMQNDKFRTFP